MSNVPDDQVQVHFICKVKGCHYFEQCDRWQDVHGYDVDKSHMISHYMWEHADLFRKKIRGEGGQSWDYRYEYGLIPDEIQPVVVYQEFDKDGELLSETITKFSNDL